MGVEAEEGVVEAEERFDTRRPTTWCMMKMPRRRIKIVPVLTRRILYQYLPPFSPSAAFFER